MENSKNTSITIRNIHVNGRVIHNIKGDVTIVNGKMLVNGKPLEEYDEAIKDEKVVNITIEGDVERLEVDTCETITVKGNAKRIKTNMGDIEIGGDVSGDVHTNMGSITCGKIEGDCHTNMGSIYNR
jgi:DNA polymerase/3'-5' exonuclease PolX